MKSKTVVLLALVCLALTACGRRWEQLWGQDTRPEVRYVHLVPNVLEADVVGDLFFVMDKRIADARYICIYAVDIDDVKLGLPYYDKNSGKTAAALIDGNRITFVNIMTALPQAVRVRIEYVL